MKTLKVWAFLYNERSSVQMNAKSSEKVSAFVRRKPGARLLNRIQLQYMIKFKLNVYTSDVFWSHVYVNTRGIRGGASGFVTSFHISVNPQWNTSRSPEN